MENNKKNTVIKKYIFCILIIAIGVYMYKIYPMERVAFPKDQVEESNKDQYQAKEATDVELQSTADLFGDKWNIVDDNSTAKLYIANGSIKPVKVHDKELLKVMIRYDYKYQDTIFGSEVRYTVFQVWLQPEKHCFRIVKRENFDHNGNCLAIRRYSIEGQWEDYTANSTWRAAMEEVASFGKNSQPVS